MHTYFPLLRHQGVKATSFNVWTFYNCATEFNHPQILQAYIQILNSIFKIFWGFSHINLLDIRNLNKFIPTNPPLWGIEEGHTMNCKVSKFQLGDCFFFFRVCKAIIRWGNNSDQLRSIGTIASEKLYIFAKKNLHLERSKICSMPYKMGAQIIFFLI